MASDTPPGAFPPPSSPVGPSGILAPLASALGQCLCIVLAGFLCRQWGLFSSTDAQGLSAFVGRCSLPALLFLAMVNLDIETMDWPIFYTLASTKIAVFLGTVVCCRLALSDGKRRAILDEPIGLVRDSSIRSTLSGSTAADDCDECELNAAAARSAEAPSPWVCRAGLYAIFATQSNDFALGLPLFSAVWGPRFLPMIYVLAPVQLALLNPLGFALIEWGNSDATDTACRRCARVLSKLLRSPLVASVVAGAVVKTFLVVAGAPRLPEPIEEFFDAYRQTFTAAALTTLGLSLRTKLTALQDAPTASASLVLVKVLVTPLLIRILGDVAFGVSHEDARNFAFLYGMLPSAPTVVVFAREYAAPRNSARNSAQFGAILRRPLHHLHRYRQPADGLAALQLVGLLLSAPFLVVSTAFLTMPEEAVPRALGLIDNIDLGVAAVGAALGGLTLVLLRLHARRLRAAGAATPPFITLQVLCGAALLFNGATLLHAAAGGCEGAGAATGAVVRFAAGLSTYTFRGGAALLALLMAHASCPERSMRARAEWVARAYRRGAAALAVVLVGSELTELVVSLVDTAAAGGGGGGGGNLTLAAAAAAALANPGPAAPTAGEPFCGGSTPAIKWFHLVFEGATTIVTTIALGLIRLAPLRGPHPAELPAAQLNAVTPTTAEVLTPGDEEEEEAAAPRVPPQPPATTTTLVQPLLAELPASLPATAPPPAVAPPPPLPPCGDACRAAQVRACAALLRWKTRVSLLLLFVVLSSLASLCVLVASATRGVLSSGVQLEVLLLGRMLLFAHGIALFALFGTARELVNPLLASFTRAVPPAFPRTSSMPVLG